MVFVSDFLISEAKLQKIHSISFYECAKKFMNHMIKDGHVQVDFDEFESFSNFHILLPLFHPGDSKNRIETIFGAT